MDPSSLHISTIQRDLIGDLVRRYSHVMCRLLTLCFLLLAAASASSAQRANEEPTYRVETEVTVSGTVSAVFFHTGGRGTSRSRATLALADGATADIHIGPTSFVREKEMELAPGDRVTASGSRTAAGLVIVRRLVRGKQTLDVRNAAGRPLWEERHK